MNTIQEIRNHILITLRKWLGIFCATVWNYRLVKRILHPYVYEPKNAKLKNIHAGKRAFIIGNGPSILKQDLTKLNGEIVFVLNDFFLHPQYHKINPTYLCSCDPMLIDPKYRIRWYKLHKKYDTSKTTMFFKKSAQKIDQKYHLFQKHKVYYIRSASLLLPPLSSLKTCPTDLTMPLSGHFLVLTDVALMAAYYMGIKKVYLLGFDSRPINSLHDYLYYDFYGKNPLFSLEDYKRDYEFYLSKSYKKSRVDLHERTVACLKRTFAKKRMNIYNATHDKGYFEGFRHVDFEKVIKKEM